MNFVDTPRVVAFIGVDGSGKTTWSGKSLAYLRQRGLKVVYLQVFDYLLLRPILSTVKVFIARSKGVKKENVFSQKAKRPSLFKTWPLFALVDNWAFYFFKIKPKILRDQWVVCDRYFYDLAVNFQYLSFSSFSLFKLYAKLIPKPDLVFVLDTKPAVALKRSGEFELAYYQEQRILYQQLAKMLGFTLINTTGPLEKTEERIKRELEKMVRK